MARFSKPLAFVTVTIPISLPQWDIFNSNHSAFFGIRVIDQVISSTEEQPHFSDVENRRQQYTHVIYTIR
jgi:hypothetical protein